MLIRLLIFGVLIIMLYRAAKSLMRRNDKGGGGPAMKPSDHVDDVMIKDPNCGAYFPRRSAVVWEGPEEKLFFCSTRCRDRYLEKMEKHQHQQQDNQ